MSRVLCTGVVKICKFRRRVDAGNNTEKERECVCVSERDGQLPRSWRREGSRGAPATGLDLDVATSRWVGPHLPGKTLPFQLPQLPTPKCRWVRTYRALKDNVTHL